MIFASGTPGPFCVEILKDFLLEIDDFRTRCPPDHFTSISLRNSYWKSLIFAPGAPRIILR